MLTWIKKLVQWCRRLGKPTPPCGTPDPHSKPSKASPDQPIYGGTPQCGPDVQPAIRPIAKLTPHGGLSPLPHPWPTLDAIEHTWSGSVAAVECRQWCARDLAREFHRFLQAQPGLVGAAIRWEWIYASYPLFCRWLRVGRPPPYKDFARELALIMPRKRKDPRQGGKRLGAFTVYIVEPLEKPGQQGVSDVTETLERRLRG